MQTLAYFAVFVAGCIVGVWASMLFALWLSYEAWKMSDAEKFLAESEK